MRPTLTAAAVVASCSLLSLPAHAQRREPEGLRGPGNSPRLATLANVNAADAGKVAAGLTTYQKAHLVFMLPHSGNAIF